MKIITEEQYRDIMKKHNELILFIVEKTEELSLIQYGKYPKGECCDTDFEEENNKLMVQFESYLCGESDYETFYLPLEFLFDESYPEQYKLIWEEEKRQKKEEKLQKEKDKQEKAEKTKEEYDIKEYYRLKSKFEGIKYSVR